MKSIFIYIVLLTIALNLNGQPWINNLPQTKLQNGELTFYEIQQAFNEYWEPFNVENGYYELNGEQVKAPYWKQFKRWEWYWENRVNPKTGKFPKTSAWDELQKYIKENPGAKSSGGTWANMGPNTTTGGYAGLGRLNCVAFVPNDNNTIYVGAASGGIWKTTNGGSSWLQLGDNNPVLGVSDIVVYRPVSEPDVIYIGTGDRDGGSMWSLGGGQYNDNNSVGILKSIDGGVTWSTTGLSWTASQQRTINRMLMDPGNINTLYAATSAGLYKTTNAGVSWSLQTSTNFVDIEFKPGTSSTIYASNWSGDIYRSTNSGSSFSSVFTSSNGRAEIAVTPNNVNVVYALMDGSGGLGGIYKSTNGGTSFSQVYNGSLNLLGWNCDGSDSGDQGSYDLCIAADPNNANNVFVGGVNTWRSTDGGVNWSASTHWSGCSGITTVHADKHFLKYQNSTSNLFECNDGGLYKTINNGSSWTHVGNGLIISQIYRLGTAQTSSNDVIIGLQDNGTKALLSGTWSDEIGGDGFECAYDYTNHNTMYGEIYYGALRRSTNHGGSWSSITSGLTGSAHWCAPFVIDPNVNTTLYMGYQDVFKSTNQGTSWSSISSWGGNTLRSLTVAPSNSNYIYAATQSNLYRTTNGGSSWSSNLALSLPTGSGSITYISVKDTDPNTIWVSLGGYNSYGIYQSTNGGASWTNISAGLPSIPVMCVIQNKLNTSENELYAGTDVGVYVKVGSSNWFLFSSGLPNVVVTELEIYYAPTTVNSRLRAATYGRGLWESDLYSGNIPPVADFSASTTIPPINTDVIFTDLSTNLPTSWSWSFNPSTVVFVNGTNATSQNPEVQFTEVVPYTVTLTSTNTFGNDAETKINYIDVAEFVYCIPTYNTGTGAGDYISLVQIGTINNSSVASVSSPFYTYYDFLSTDLTQDESSSVTVSAGTYGSGNNISVWIDFNYNGIFETAEKLGNVTLGAMPATGTINFTVPTDAVVGTTRMRVREVWNNTNFTSCDPYDYGETEDYNINILGKDLRLNLTVLLEGPYNSGTNLMNLDLYSGGYIPLGQPYNPALPYYSNPSPIWLYPGSENVGSIPANVVDWVVVQVRDANSPANATSSTTLGTQAGFLLSNGSIVATDGVNSLSFNVTLTQNLYAVVFHRNHLGVMSNFALTESGGIYTYNFTSGENQVFGSSSAHKELEPGVWGMVAADGDADGFVLPSDETNAWLIDLNQPANYLGGDFNLDGLGLPDDETNFWLPNSNKAGQIPGKSNNDGYKSFVPK